ncbi:MAG: hypothetical protein H0U73_07010 [Tatlockia sp.]|nr:hypothetical protein [Tatlockia sp.]
MRTPIDRDSLRSDLQKPKKDQGMFEGILDTVIPVGLKIYSFFDTPFFSPFNSFKDAGAQLVSPIFVPVAAGALTIFCAIGLAAASIVFVGGLLIAAASYAFNADFAEGVGALGVVGGFVGLMCSCAILLAAIVGVIGAVEEVAKLTTRAAATIVDQAKGLCGSGVEEFELTSYPSSYSGY